MILKYKTLLVNLAFITLYVGNEVLAVILSGSGAGFWDFFPFYLIELLFFYVYIYWLYPAFQSNFARKIIIAMLVATALFLHLCLYDLANEGINLIYSQRKPIHFGYSEYFRNLYRAIYIAIMAALYFVGRLNAQNMVKVKNAEANVLRLENAYLQAQTNPHLLFNTLNLIYGSINRCPDHAAEAILLLADIMTYNMRDTPEDGLSPLSDEVAQIERYIKLNQLRLGDSFQLHFHHNVGKRTNLRIPPLLLLTLIENMFKHGCLKNGLFMASASLLCSNELIHFHTENEKSDKEVYPGRHIGLNNTRARLENSYSGRYDLNITQPGNNFVLDLKIRI